MKHRVLFVGDCREYLAETAKDYSPTAVLIDHGNHEQYTKDAAEWVGYTSLADLPKDLTIFYNLIESADEIFYCPPAAWSDNKAMDMDRPTESMQGLTEYYLCAVHKLKNNVVGLDFDKIRIDQCLALNETRNSNDPCIWVAGCSTTQGIGVLPEQRYGILLSKRLQLPVYFLAQSGASISWAADQILRSDVRPNDVVIWGLTEENRLSIWDDDHEIMLHLKAGSENKTELSDRTVKELLVHKNNFAMALQKIHEVVNFCLKTKSKLLIFNIHSSNFLNFHLANVKQFFLHLLPKNQFVDLGSDQIHPGPKQHQDYANFCHSALVKLQYI